MGIITFTTIRQNHPHEGKIVQALPIYLGFPACAPLKMFDLNKHSILLRPFPLKEDSDAPTKNQIVDMVDICFSKGYQEYAIHSVQLICVQFSYTYVYANYTHIIQIHIHILSYIYRYLLYIFLTYIFVLMDFSHQIHGGPIFQLAPSNVSAAVKLRPVPAREFQANSSIRKQAGSQAPNFLMKRKGGNVECRWTPRFFKKKTYKHQQKHVCFFFRCLYFFSWSDASNVNISLWHVLWTDKFASGTKNTGDSFRNCRLWPL